MRRRSLLPLLAATAAAALAIAVGAARPDGAGAARSVERFAALATTGIHTDFTPMASPDDAVDKADLIVEGTLGEVVDGIRLRHLGSASTRRDANSHVTLVVNVTKVIDGDAGKVSGGRVYLALATSAATTPAQLAAANPHPRIVAVLDDITTWTPARGITVVRPTAIPAGVPLYAPYLDGLWLQASGDARMHSLGAHREELAAAWGNPQRVDDFSAALRSAAQR